MSERVAYVPLLNSEGEDSEKWFQRVNRFAESCLRFTPKISLRFGKDQVEGLFLEIGGSAAFFKEAGLGVRLKALLRRFEFQKPPQIAFGVNASHALALSRLGLYREVPLLELPLESLQDFASPFRRNEELLKHVLQMRTTLDRLGIERLEDFVRLPRWTLSSRFGLEGLELARRVQGLSKVVWPHFQPIERIEEKEDLTGNEVYELEPLFFILNSMIHRVVSRLHGRGQKAATVVLGFKMEYGSEQRKWVFELPVPQSSVRGLSPLLRERLSAELASAPLKAPVREVFLSIKETAPGNSAQRNFFHQREEEEERWESLVGRLCEKLKEGKVYRAQRVDRHLPERNWKKTLARVKSEDNVFALLPKRPTRLLPVPKRLEKQTEQNHLYCVHENRRWRLLRWEGPERISGEWWLDSEGEGFHRDYYKVVTEEGQQLWVFRNKKKELFLHGYFD